MAFYSINESANIQVDGVDSSLDTVEESTFDNHTEAALYNIAVSESNMNALFQRMGMLECSYYREHNEELVYNEGAFSDIIDKLKAIVLKIWDKMKEMFKRFTTIIDRFFMEDKAFAKKYGPEIRKKTPKDLTFKGYKFTFDKGKLDKISNDVGNFIDKYCPETEDAVKLCVKIKEDVEDTIEDLRSTAASGCTTQKDLQKEFFQMLRNDSASKEVIDLTSDVINDALDQLTNGKKARDEATKEFRKEEKNIKKYIENYNKLEKKINDSWTKLKSDGSNKDMYKHGGFVGKDDNSYGDGDQTAKVATGTKRSDAITACMVFGKLSNAGLAIEQLLFGSVLTASKDYSRQCKAICARMVHYNESANVWNHTESASVDDLFGNVKFN